MRKYLLCILIVGFFASVNAQQSVFSLNSGIGVDSIRYLLSLEKTDTVKVRLLNNLADKYIRLEKKDSVLWYAQKALALSIKTHYLKGEFESRKWGPILFRAAGDYPNALKLAFQNLRIAEKIKDPFVILMGLHGVARTYDEMKDYTNQLIYNRKSKQIINSGYFKQEKDVKFKRLSFYLVMMGSAFEKLNQLDSALYYMTAAYSTALELSKDESLALTALNLGNIYFKLGKYDSAFIYYKKTSPYVEKIQYRYDVAGEAQLGLAQVFKNREQPDSALYYSKLSLSTFHKIRYPLGELEAATLLNTIYVKKNRTDSAYKYLELTYALKDSLYNQEKTKQIEEVKYSDALKRQQAEQERREAQQRYETRLKISGLIVGLGVLILVAFFLYRNNKQRQKANILLHQKNDEIDKQRAKAEQALTELKATQSQLIQSEKMASLGEMTAGIAHEIQNPLNFVNNFAEVNKELIEEASQANEAGNPSEVKELLSSLRDNEEKINHHGKRADAIVKGMLQHSRSSSGVKESTDINALADEYLRLSYHGLRAKDNSFNATMKTDFDESACNIKVIPQELGRVLLNLYNNAFYVISEKKKQQPEGYEPTVSVNTKMMGDRVEIRVQDNGNGIPQKVVNKIFQPFFTTKPTGQGTGLGLSLAYDIIKAHGGELKVETKEGEGSAFIIQLPNQS